jgi:hypothetical protein
MDQPLDRLKLIALVQRLLTADHQDEEEGERLLEALMQHVLDPQVSDYIFWPDRPMTAEQIVDRALAYQPLVADYSVE